MEFENFIEQYKISTQTMLITPYFDDYGNVYSHVVEESKELFVKEKPLKIIEESCKHFGSDLRGRQKSTESLVGFTYKQPVAIEPFNNIYFFPAESPNSVTCSWLSHTHILRIYKGSEQDSKIVFNNGKSYNVSGSKYSLVNQLHRTAQLRCMLEQRIMRQKDYYFSFLPRVADQRKSFERFPLWWG